MHELEVYRQQIREINGKILLLLKERLEVVKNVGELKLRENIPLRNVEVENNQINELRMRGATYGLDGDYVEELFRRIIAYSVEIEKKMGVSKI